MAVQFDLGMVERKADPAYGAATETSRGVQRHIFSYECLESPTATKTRVGLARRSIQGNANWYQCALGITRR
jgi:hypothetical protein